MGQSRSQPVASTPNLDTMIPPIVIPPTRPLVDKTIIKNPGTMCDMHRECRDVMPICFDGLKILLNNPINSHFQTGHLFSLVQSTPSAPPGRGGFASAAIHPSDTSNYKFHTTLVGEQRLTSAPAELYPAFYGDIDAYGNVSANAVHYVLPKMRVRYNGQFQMRPRRLTQGQLSCDLFGRRSTLSLTVVNVNQNYEPDQMIAQYLRAVTPNVALGFEVCYNNAEDMLQSSFGRQSTAASLNRTTVSATAQFRIGDDQVWTVSGGETTGMQISVYRKCSDTLRIGVETVVNMRTKECSTTLGYRTELADQHFVFRGMLDSNGTVGSTLEKGLHPFPLALTISTFINHPKNYFRLGCSVVLK